MFYHFKIHKESNGYWAECIELEGCHAQGDTISELEADMEESLNLLLSEPMDSKHQFPFPSVDKKLVLKKNVKRVAVDSSVAFAMLMRQTRLKHRLTLRRMADILEYKNLNTYVKLEKAKTSNPELRTLQNIKNHFSDFPLDLLFDGK